jgi:curli production assembly/transport component CsgG/holdfast attachment protein HfaB
LEPIQLAVRSMIERATLEMITRIYRAPGPACAIPLGNSDDPLRGAGEYYPQMAYAGPQPYPPQPAYYAPPSYQTSYGDAGRGTPYRGYYDPDPGLVNLRGGL